jgi:hypothetical protein
LPRFKDDEQLLNIFEHPPGGSIILVGEMERYPVLDPTTPGLCEIRRVRPADGIGRWVYCKYCYKNVRPVVMMEELPPAAHWPPSEMVLCSECSAGLTAPVAIGEGGVKEGWRRTPWIHPATS